MKKSINGQLDIKLGQFIEEKLDTVLKTIKSWKASGLNEIWSMEDKEIWQAYFSDYSMLPINKTQ